LNARFAAVLYALVTASLVGLMTGVGVVPFLFRTSIPRRLYDAILGMGAGLMLSAATLGLLAEALHDIRHDGEVDAGVLIQVLVGFAIGALVLVLMERIPHQHAGGHLEHITRHHDVLDSIHPHEHEHHEEVRKGILITGAMTIHRIPEGFAIGAGFAAGPARTLGWVLAVAVAFQNACEGAVMAAPLRHAGWTRTRVFLTVAATGLATPLAAILGYLAGTHLTALLPFSLAVASGALIYLISNEIIPETHSHGNESLATLGIVCGFAVTIVVSSMGHG
jgi:ZIP family zinc transporter